MTVSWPRPLQVEESGEAETCTTSELFERTLETAISNAGATPYSRSTIPGMEAAPSGLAVGYETCCNLAAFLI